MSEQNYPARGKMSEDGKYYTQTDGTVHELMRDGGCSECSLTDIDCEELKAAKCGSGAFRLIEGAYVQSDEEREACDMARAMIKRQCLQDDGCEMCYDFYAMSCPARVYLAAKHQPDAWEVKP